MTEQHRAKPEAWANVEAYAKTWNSDSCILELRDRVEALEAAQRPTIPECNEDYWRRDALEKLLHAATSYRLDVYGAEELEIFEDRARRVLACWDKKPATRLHSYRVENSALPIEEWGKGHTIVDSAKPPVTRDRAGDAPAPSHSLVKRVAYAIYINAMAGDSEQALAAIHAIADWFEQQGSHTTAARLRQEAG